MSRLQRAATGPTVRNTYKHRWGTPTAGPALKPRRSCESGSDWAVARVRMLRLVLLVQLLLLLLLMMMLLHHREK